MKLRGWASLLLAAVVGLSGQRADASYARLDTGLPAIESSLLQAPSPAVTEIPADAWLVESIIPLGTTADGQPLALISFLVPLSSLDEIAPASTRAGPYAAPETHTRVFCIVQPPLGLEMVAPGVWRVEAGESLWAIYDKAIADNDIQLTRQEFLANVQAFQKLGGRNKDVVQPDQLLVFYKPDESALVKAHLRLAFLGSLRQRSRRRGSRLANR